MALAKSTIARHTLDFQAAVDCIDYSTCLARRSQAYLRTLSFLCNRVAFVIGLRVEGSMLCQYVTICNEIFFANMSQFFIQKKLQRKRKPLYASIRYPYPGSRIGGRETRPMVMSTHTLLKMLTFSRKRYTW